MDGRLLLLLSALLVLAPSREAISQPELAQPLGKLPSNLSPTFPRVSVDYVVTYAAWRGWGPKGSDRVVLYRHGALVRTDADYIGSKRANEASHTEGYSNLATAAALSITRDDKGSVASVWITRGGPDDIPIFRRRIIATGDTETIAGERCQIWSAKPETNEGVASTSCITTDGVVLRETVLYHDGSTMDERRAIKVERRHVRLSEVLPPFEALRWSRWATRTAAAPAGEKQPANYDLTMVGDKRGEPLAKTVRRAAGWYLEQDDSGTAARSLQITGPGVTLSYYNRTFPQMNINRGMTSILTDPRRLQSAPMDKPDEQVIGEDCTWYNAAINMSDYGRYECRTRDQVPLRRDEYGWGDAQVSWVATSLHRGLTARGSIKPLPLLTDWTFWGWPELS